MRRPRARTLAALGVLALAGGVAIAGCAGLEAMRLYRSGTRALDRGDAPRALADLERAATLAPDLSGIQNHLGIAYESNGRPEDALRAYERAVDLDCSNQAARANLEALEARIGAADARAGADP